MGPWYHGQWATSDGTQHGNVQFGSNTASGTRIILKFLSSIII